MKLKPFVVGMRCHQGGNDGHKACLGSNQSIQLCLQLFTFHRCALFSMVTWYQGCNPMDLYHWSLFAVAVELALSPKTVETYRSRLMPKLNVNDLPSLERFAFQHGLLDIETGAPANTGAA